MNSTRTRDGRPGFTNLPDLASRRVGGSVIGASDELFAERENLIKPEPPVYSAHTFGHKGQIYDGWETRRRREPGDDFALIRLGLPGVVSGHPAPLPARSRPRGDRHPARHLSDGGMARLRLLGAVADAARDDLALRWFNLLPESHARAVLAASGDAGRAVLAARPLSSVTQLPAALQAQLRG